MVNPASAYLMSISENVYFTTSLINHFYSIYTVHIFKIITPTKWGDKNNTKSNS